VLLHVFIRSSSSQIAKQTYFYDYFPFAASPKCSNLSAAREGERKFHRPCSKQASKHNIMGNGKEWKLPLSVHTLRKMCYYRKDN